MYQWAIFQAELIQLNIVEFDTIIGMDWLAHNHALVDYRMKNIKLWDLTKNKLSIMENSRNRNPSYLLPRLESHEIGEYVYLAMIREVKEETTLALDEISIVKEFPDVFLKNSMK